MSYVGIDIEQFVTDPYATGIQRVLLQLAREWPSDVKAYFVVPHKGGHGLLTPAQAAEILAIPFSDNQTAGEMRLHVQQAISNAEPTVVFNGELLSIFDRWLLPEVSYLPSVLDRFEMFSQCMPTTMIGYDILPMSEPANYRFAPGKSARVSEYFRNLAKADSVICISEFAREGILDRLRRDRSLVTEVAHPGGDHLEARSSQAPKRARFIRLGTLEARKQPVEILDAFIEAIDAGMEADLLFVGNNSASHSAINDRIAGASASGYPVQWIERANDSEVHELINASTYFLSIGIEGYGIPVLEAIRLGTPVLFAGVQPAGEIMRGLGAREIRIGEGFSLSGALADSVSAEVQQLLRDELAPDAVPTWQEFTRHVARAALAAR